MQRRHLEIALAAVLFAPLAASAQDAVASVPAPPAAAATETDTGTVVFFREKKFAGAAIRYKVRENGIELCKLRSGTYCRVVVPAGKHEYVVHSEAKDVLTLEVAAGETHYVIGGVTVGVFAGHPDLTPSDQHTFEGMLPKLRDNTGQDLDPPGAGEQTAEQK